MPEAKYPPNVTTAPLSLEVGLYLPQISDLRTIEALGTIDITLRVQNNIMCASD
jgi:hypothetical protein